MLHLQEFRKGATLSSITSRITLLIKSFQPYGSIIIEVTNIMAAKKPEFVPRKRDPVEVPFPTHSGDEDLQGKLHGVEEK